MAAFVDNSSLNVSERNSMAITLNIHTKSHTVRGRPTQKLVEHFGTRSVRELYERSIYERSFTSEPSTEKYQAKSAHLNLTTMYKRGRKLQEFVYERIRRFTVVSPDVLFAPSRFARSMKSFCRD